MSVWIWSPPANRTFGTSVPHKRFASSVVLPCLLSIKVGADLSSYYRLFNSHLSFHYSMITGCSNFNQEGFGPFQPKNKNHNRCRGFIFFTLFIFTLVSTTISIDSMIRWSSLPAWSWGKNLLHFWVHCSSSQLYTSCSWCNHCWEWYATLWKFFYLGREA